MLHLKALVPRNTYLITGQKNGNSFIYSFSDGATAHFKNKYNTSNWLNKRRRTQFGYVCNLYGDGSWQRRCRWDSSCFKNDLQKQYGITSGNVCFQDRPLKK